LNLREVLGSVPQGFEEFMKNRLEAYLEPYGYDVVRAVLEVKDPLKPLDAIRLAQILANLKETEKFKDIVEAYRRVVKILPKEWEDERVEEDLMKEKEERELWEKVKGLEGERLEPLDLWNLKEPIDRFFDRVLVMDKDQELRRNRLALLLRIKKLFNRFGDLEKIVLEV